MMFAHGEKPRPPRQPSRDYYHLFIGVTIGFVIGRNGDWIEGFAVGLVFTLSWWLFDEVVRYVGWAKLAEGEGDPTEAVKRIIRERREQGLEDAKIYAAVTSARSTEELAEPKTRWVLYRRRALWPRLRSRSA